MKNAMIMAAPALALALASQAMAQQPPGLVETFKQTCLTGGLKPADILKRARALGFTDPPATVAEQMRSPTIPYAQSVWIQQDSSAVFVIAGDGPSMGNPKAKSDYCGVSALPQQVDPTPALKTLLGVGDGYIANGQLIFLYQDKAGTRRAIKQNDTDALLNAATERRLRTAMVINRPGAPATTLLLAAPN